MDFIARILANKFVKAAINEIASVIVAISAFALVTLIGDSQHNQKKIKTQDRKNNVQLLH
jgi:hypothetical protein